MKQQLPATEETVEQSIRRFADQKFRRLGLVNGATELDAIADRAAGLKEMLADMRVDIVNADKLSTIRRRALELACNESWEQMCPFLDQAREEGEDEANGKA